jgi:methyl-accepting chemotaxis protein
MSVNFYPKFRWTLTSMVLSTAILAASITSLAGLFALYEMNLIKINTTELTDEWLPKVSRTGEISTNIVQFRKGEWEALDDKDAAEMKDSEDHMNESGGNVTIYSKTFSKLINDEETQKSFDKFSSLWDKYSDLHDKFMVAVKAKKIEDAKVVLNGDSQKVFNDMMLEMKNLSNISFQGSLSAKDLTDKITIRARWLVGCIAGVSFLISFFVAWMIARFISKKIEGVVSKLNIAAEVLADSILEISSSSNNLSESVTEQVSALDQTVASVCEISNKVDQNNLASEKTLSASAKSMLAADEGMNCMNEVMGSIGNISHGMEELLGKIEESHREIAEIVTIISAIGDKTKVINDIVFQTRLLSFNASVEAARAGEHGKGFAVVAEEVGKLAQMSGQSASEIGILLDSSTRKVHEIVGRAKEQTSRLVTTNKEQINIGNQTAKKCSNTLQEIRDNINMVNEMISKIAEASTEQGDGLKEISCAMSQLHDTTSFNSNIAQVTSKEAMKLDNQAKEQSFLIEDLSKLIKRAA